MGKPAPIDILSLIMLADVNAGQVVLTDAYGECLVLGHRAGCAFAVSLEEDLPIPLLSPGDASPTGETFTAEGVADFLLDEMLEGADEGFINLEPAVSMILAKVLVTIGTPEALIASSWAVDAVVTGGHQTQTVHQYLELLFARSVRPDAAGLAPGVKGALEQWMEGSRDEPVLYSALKGPSRNHAPMMAFLRDNRESFLYVLAAQRPTSAPPMSITPLADGTRFLHVDHLYTAPSVAIGTELGGRDGTIGMDWVDGLPSSPADLAEPDVISSLLRAWPDSPGSIAWNMRDASVPHVDWYKALVAGLCTAYLEARALERPEPKKYLRAAAAILKKVPPAERHRFAKAIPELLDPKGKKLLAPMTAGTTQPKYMSMARELIAPIIRAICPLTDDPPSASPSPPTIAQPPPPASQESSQRPSPPAAAALPIKAGVRNLEVTAFEWPLAQVDGAFDLAVAASLLWLSGRVGAELPMQWAAGVHEREFEGTRLQVATAQGVFAFRLEHPDSHEIARTWRLDGTLAQGADGMAMAGLRLSCHDRGSAPIKAPWRSVPGMVRGWMDSPGLAVAPGEAPRHVVHSNHTLFLLRNAIREQDRPFAIWVVRQSQEAQFRGLSALAQLWVVEEAFVQQYESKFKPIETGTWHAYEPGQASAFVHQVRDAGRRIDNLVQLSTRRNSGIPRFTDVIDHVQAKTAADRASELFHAPAATASTRDAATQEEQDPSSTAELKQLLDGVESEVDTLRRELELSRQEVKALKGRLRSQQALLDDADQRDGGEANAHVPFPESLAGIEEWSRSLYPRVQFASKAIRTASRIEHDEPERIYATLQALHDHYWPMRWGDDPGARGRWEAFLDANRLRCGATGTAIDNHRFAEGYQAFFGRKRLTMDLHIQGNSGRDPRRCLRIYFSADDANGEPRVCIGHLPSHLENTLS